MKDYIQVGVYGSAIRTESWIKLYKNIVNNNKINIEVVFCGNVRPKFELPKNFKFIYSNVKPAQCSTIALHNTSSDLVSLIGDDCVYSKSYFDNLYEFYKKNKNYIVGGRFLRNKLFYKREDYMLFKNIPDSPILPPSPIMSKKEMLSVGGVDQNFIALLWHEDLIMRLITSKQKKTKILDNSIIKELTLSDFNILTRLIIKIKKKFMKNYISPGPNLFQNYGKNFDLPYLLSCWIGSVDTVDKKNILFQNSLKFISKTRLKKVVSYEFNTILDKTQGPKGKW